MRWVAHDIPGVLFGSRLVRPLLEHVSYHLGYVMAGNPGGPVARSSLPTVATSGSTAPTASRAASKSDSPVSPSRSGNAMVESDTATSITHLTALQVWHCRLHAQIAALSAFSRLLRPHSILFAYCDFAI